MVKPIDVSGEIAKVARIAFDACLLLPDTKERFVKQFVTYAGDSMAHPERIEDVEHFVELAVDQLLADRDLRQTLCSLVRSAVVAYMRPV